MAASIPLCTTRILPVHICFVMSAALSTKKQKTQNQTILTAHNLLYPPPLPNRPAHTHTKVGKKQPTKPTSTPPPYDIKTPLMQTHNRDVKKLQHRLFLQARTLQQPLIAEREDPYEKQRQISM